MEQVLILSSSPRHSLLKFIQHYDAEHRFECPICDDEFTTEGARDWARPF